MNNSGKRSDTLKVNTNSVPGGNKTTTRGEQGSITTPDIQAHLERLQGISTAASRIFALLGEQITSASATIPVQRGQENLSSLKSRAKTHREDLKTAFDPLREHISGLKADFWSKNREQLKDHAQKYIQQKVKDIVRAEVVAQIRRYVDYLENNEANNRELREASEVSHVRLQNSLLRVKYPGELVVWIGDLPSGSGPAITFGELTTAEGHLMANLAESLGISPAQEDDKIATLNDIMRKLGIAYKGLPSRTGVLLMPTTTSH